MMCLRRLVPLVVLVAATLFYSVAAAMTAYEARDVCTGLAAAYLNASDKTQFTYVNGKFKVEGNSQQITIFENAVAVVTIPKFDYENYTDCVERVIGK